jgi:hypothetical protein
VIIPLAVGKEADMRSPLKTTPCGDKISISNFFIYLPDTMLTVTYTTNKFSSID